MADGFHQETKDIVEMLVKSIKDINYGSVTIVIHDGKIVQFEKNEKKRVC